MLNTPQEFDEDVSTYRLSLKRESNFVCKSNKYKSDTSKPQTHSISGLQVKKQFNKLENLVEAKLGTKCRIIQPFSVNEDAFGYEHIVFVYWNY